MSDNQKNNPQTFQKNEIDWFSKTSSNRKENKNGKTKKKTTKQLAHEAFLSGNGKLIAKYTRLHWTKKGKEKDIVSVAEKIFDI